MATDWNLIIAIVALFATALGGVLGAGIVGGIQREKIRALEAWKIEAVAEMKVMQTQLADGRTSFTEIRGELKGMNTTLGDIKADIEKLIERS